MNKAELIAAIAAKTGDTKKVAEELKESIQKRRSKIV